MPLVRKGTTEIGAKKSLMAFFLVDFASLSCTNGTGVEEGHLEVNGMLPFYKTMGSGKHLASKG